MNWIKNKIVFYKNISFFKFLYLNYFSKNIVRKGKGKIIPYKNAIIDLQKNSKIIVEEGDIEIGTNKLKGSRTETFVRLRTNAVWKAKKRCEISYGATVEILENSILDSQYFTMNSFSVLISSKLITLGNDVMIGRNVTIYDSDFHSLTEKSKEKVSLPVYIGNHVWLTSNVVILKGVSINDGSVIAAGSLVTRDIVSKNMVASKNDIIILKENVYWER